MKNILAKEWGGRRGLVVEAPGLLVERKRKGGRKKSGWWDQQTMGEQREGGAWLI